VNGSPDPFLRFRPELAILQDTNSSTEDAELTRAFEVLDEIRETGAWRRWERQPAPVT
jgi:hypothetical protein